MVHDFGRELQHSDFQLSVARLDESRRSRSDEFIAAVFMSLVLLPSAWTQTITFIISRRRFIIIIILTWGCETVVLCMDASC